MILEDLGVDDIALAAHVEAKACVSQCGPSEMPSSPRSSSSSSYHEVNKTEVSRIPDDSGK